MFYTLLSVFIVLVGLALVYAALRLLARRNWLMGFLRGFVGLGLLVVALSLGLIAFDLFSYRQLAREEPVATLSFERLGTQYFEATLVHSDGREDTFELRGDQWQMDARIIRWRGPLGGLGIKPGYRLDRISGRYYTLSEERGAERTVYALEQTGWGPDIWAWANTHPAWLPIVDARYGSATFVPMADKALFQVSLSSSGLVARPLNDPARQAISFWE